MTNNEYIQEVGVPSGNHGFQPKRPCNRAHEYADAFGFGPYNYAGTTASSQEDNVFSQFIAKSSEEIRALILSLVGNTVLSSQYCLPKTRRTFILMRAGCCRLGDYIAIEAEHWRAEADHDRASQVGCECGLCGVRSRFIHSSHVLFCEMEMYTRPTRLPYTRRVKDALWPFAFLGLVSHCESCMCCLGLKAETMHALAAEGRVLPRQTRLPYTGASSQPGGSGGTSTGST